MKYKMGLIFVCLIICLFSIASVCASDINETDNQLKENSIKSFDQLYDEINSGQNVINLDSDYIKDSEYDDYIDIPEKVTIDGKGHSLDLNNNSKIFYSSEDDIVIKNFIFKNTYYGEEHGSAISFEGKNCLIDNCTFINNYHDYSLIEFNGENGKINNCKFVNNNVNNLISFDSNNFTVSFCEIHKNVVSTSIYASGDEVTIKNNIFQNNKGNLIKLENNAHIINNIFNNNKHDDEHGEFIECSSNVLIKNCTFNKFKRDDGGIICLFGDNSIISDCIFKNNTIYRCINMNYEEINNTVTNCKFENNIWNEYAYINANTIVKDLKFNNNTVRYSISTEYYGAVVNYRFILGVSYTDSNGIPLAYQKVKYTLGSKSYQKTTDKYGFIEIVYKTFGTAKVVLTNPVTKERLTRQIALFKIFDKNKDVSKYYKSSTTYKVRVFNYNGKLAKGEEVRFGIGDKLVYAKVDKNGYATLKLNQKPGKYEVSVKYADYYVTNKITIKSTVVTKNLVKKVKKSGKFNVKILNGKGKAYAKQLVKINFKGKTYKIKTNNKGIATFIVPKDLKIGKYTIKTTYNGYTVSNQLTVK